MPRHSLRDGPSERSRAHPGDVSRRVAQRREQLGLSREEVAAKAGMTPSYVRYVEEQCHHTIGTNALLRLAGALRTTASHLLGGDAEHLPGETETVGPPVMEEMPSQECWTRLSGHDVGRIALTTGGGHPAVVPVNYAVVDGAIVYRTAPDAPPSLAKGSEIAFEVDQLDARLSAGWSVLVLGVAERVVDPEDTPALETHPGPWSGGEDDLWIRIVPTHVTGSLIRTV
ncbi:pyridoxamine 5'-phosphate oxidase family protein [Actinacidiphila glaucinigra]|uniref:helix-turn-helix domain-containing protein n=1 Tax=Actinacidiphila glaucinigra TaxID=235986 RepID=UPI00386F2D97